MKFFQSKRNRRILFFAGLLLLIAVGYVGYELYTVQVALRELDEGMETIAKIFSNFQKFTPDTAAIDSSAVADSLLVR